MRELEAADEGALQALLRRVYGSTYSYRSLYEPGGVTKLLGSGHAALWGDFAETGAIASHTAFFFKDPRADYVESGLSLRDPGLRPVTTDADVWARFFAWIGNRFAYIHQNTTTLHPLAQRYAERHMRARPAGLVIDYAVGETILPLGLAAAPMHALSMTTLVGDAHPQPTIAIPDGPWAQYLAMIATGLGLEPRVTAVAAPTTPLRLDLDPIEHNAALGLVRRSVARGPDRGLPIAAPSARVALIHVPLDERAAYLPELVAAGWVPIAIRPHATRPHEVVMQYLPGDRLAYACDALTAARLLPAGQAVIAAWRAACAPVS